MYYHPIIQKAVNAMWFQNKHDEGVIFADMFKPIPILAIAFVLTAVCCTICLRVQLLNFNCQIEANINEWLIGEKMSVTFWADEYCSVYKGHIEALEKYGHHTKKHDLIG